MQVCAKLLLVAQALGASRSLTPTRGQLGMSDDELRVRPTRRRPRLVVVVANPGGRWSAEWSGTSRGSKKARQLVESVVSPHDRSGGPVVVGLVVLESWRFVFSKASSRHTYSLMQASMTEHRKRSGQRSIEHEHRVLAAVSVNMAVRVPDLPCQWAFLPPGRMARQWLQRVRGCVVAWPLVHIDTASKKQFSFRRQRL